MRWLDGVTDSMKRESEWPQGVGDGQGGLACCNSWGHKELDRTERTELNSRKAKKGKDLIFLSEV